MSERVWRLVIGVLILLFLSLNDEDIVISSYVLNPDYALLTLIGWLYFEGLTNIRLTKIISWFRWKADYIMEMEKAVSGVVSSRSINFEAERMLRFAMASVLLACVYPGIEAYYPDVVVKVLWAIPWLVGLMLTSAGLTSICPMLMVFQWLGFKAHYH
ncbi:MAG: DUF2892 domain-containing protein [Methylococcales bacterium]|jgi:hypothetical protein|nr:DUF2892 domain-containing protein [Methylococcales bacterium]MBT7443173.1 DUF2892 domain-containing protein [Methylococcales bacterium]